jgi:acyl-CoA synthetase (AMP-forming)/AMP-acid ligase II
MQFTHGLHRALETTPDAIATICGERKRTFRQLAARVARIAGALRALDVGNGDVVAMLGFNSDHYLEYYLAVPWAGALTNPLNFRWSIDEIIFALNDSLSIVLFVGADFIEHVPALRAGCPALRTIIVCGGDSTPDGCLMLEALIYEHAPIEDAGLDPDMTYGVFYTGGTTGRAKGVLLSQRSICSSGLALLAEGPFADGCIGLHAAPMFHLADLMMTCGLLLRGGTHVMTPAFRPEIALELIERHRVTELLMVPAMMQAMVDHPDFDKRDTGHVRNLLYGASPASEALIDRALSRMPGTAFYQVYGMTEMAALISVLAPSQHAAALRFKGRLRSVGRPFCHTRLRIVDQHGVDCPHEKVGEILVRGPGMMQGYLNQPAATQEALRDGWMHTGDLGYTDASNYVFIVDRLKDMIITGGENVYCAEVENAIATHPAVASCAVIGIPSTEWGEAVHAVVVLNPGHSLTLGALADHCQHLIAGYKCPRSLQLTGALPFSGAGKVLKSELRMSFWEGRSRGVN